MPSFSPRPSLVVLIGMVTGCMLILWTLRSAPAQAPEQKSKHTYSLLFLKLPAGNGDVDGLSGCKSVSIAPVARAGETQLAALCEK